MRISDVNRFIVVSFGIFLALGFLKILTVPVPGEIGRDWVYDIPPRRGGIYDRSGRVLAVDAYVYRGYLDLDFVRKSLKFYEKIGNDEKVLSIELALERLSRNFDLPVDTLLSTSTRFLYLGEAESRSEILNLVPRDLLPYLSVELRTVRKRTECCSIPQILGSVVDGRGVGGVEGFFDDRLKGVEGGKLVLRIVKLFKVQPSLERSEPPVNGEDLFLSLDMTYQRLAYEVLKDAVNRWKAEGGDIIVMETKTGRIRAMVTTRSWNDNVLGYIEPGSSIKPIVYSITLTPGSVARKFHHTCTGKIKPVERLNVWIRDIVPHGEVDLEKALVESCNTATVKIATLLKEKIGEAGMYRWFRKFGFGKRTNVEMEGESKGVLRPPEKWSAIDFAELSIGQGIGVTPVQLISALNAVLNGGVYVKPTILEDSKVVSFRVVSEEVADTIRGFMKEVVERGTGKKAGVRGISVAGKTGTAQKAVGGRYRDYHSIFVGAFPADDPDYTILVHIDSPKGEYLGGEVAAPVFAELVRRILDLDREIPVELTPGVVPDLRGLSLKDVFEISRILGFEVVVKGSGVVMKQNPPAGTLGVSTVTVYLDQPR